MCMVDYADGDAFAFTPVERTAIKQHKCDECHRVIAKGERYENAAGIYDGRTWHAKTCAHCMWARGWLVEQCGGWLYEGVLEDLKEHWDEEHLLRSLDLGRRIIWIRHKWTRRDGTLMAVPGEQGEKAA